MRTGWATLIAAGAAILAGCADVENRANFPPPPDLEIAWRVPYGATGGGGPNAQLVAGGVSRQAPAPQFFPSRSAGGVKRLIESTETGTVTLDFANASVLEATELVVGATLEKSYSVHPDVDGLVSFRTSTPIPVDSVLPVFDIVLSQVGATLIERETVIEIVPRSIVSEAGPSVSRPGDRRAGYRIEVVALSYVDADEMRELLEPIGSAGAIIATDDRFNLILLEGTTRELEPLLETVDTFDRDFLADNSFALVPLVNANATQAVAELEDVFGNAGGGLPVRFVAITGMNAVVVVGPTDSQVQDMVGWLQRIDKGATKLDGTQIYAYFAQNVRASELANALGAVMQSGATTVNAAPGAGGDEQVVQVAAGSGPIGASNVRVVAEDQRNAVLVTAPASDWHNIHAILTRLDVAPLQVLLEVTIAEVVLNDRLEYGVQWFFENGDSRVTLSDVASGAVAGRFPGFSYVFDSSDISLALNALSDITEVRYISAPSLMVVNNQTAELQVGDEVPVLVQSVVSNEAGATTQTVQYRDTGVILQVTPRINASGLVTAEIVQEVSSVAPNRSTVGGVDSPSFQQRRFQTTVTVPDRQVIALGGLIQDQSTTGSGGVPGAKNLPVVGNLFKTTTNSRARTELLVIVTPTIVRDGAAARAVSQELRDKILGGGRSISRNP